MLCRDTTKFLHGGNLCVSTYANLKWMKAKGFSEFCDAVPIVLKSGGHKWCWPLNRAVKCRQSPSWFITRNTTFGRLLRNLMSTALRHWNQSRVLAGQQNLQKMTRPLSPKLLNVLLIFWIVHLSVGLWKNFENILSRKRLFARSALKHFEQFFMRKKSGSDASKAGKNATIRSLNLKKTNPQVCKQTRLQWPDNIFRRVRSSGDTSSTWTNLLPYKPPGTFACHLSPPSWCSALAGILRCSSEKAVGLCPSSQKTSGSLRSIKVFKEKVSEKSACSSVIRQLLAAPQGEGIAVLSKEQYSLDMDADECFMAQSYRMPVYLRERICDSWNQLSKS